jgi:lysophospholipase L1-like esterase
MVMTFSRSLKNALAALLLGALALAGHAQAPAGATASGPTPYPADAKDWPGQGAIRVPAWMNDNRKAFWLERERKQGSIVFVGDSLIGGWTTMGRDWSGLAVANRGIGGETTRGLLFRFQEDVLDLHPKAVVILTGTNDLSAQQDIRQTRANLVEILEKATRAAPDMPIVLCTVPPRANPQSPIEPKQLIQLNLTIAALAQGRRNTAVLDLYALLANADGAPQPEYFAADRLHLSTAGYRRFRDALLPVFKQLRIE